MYAYNIMSNNNNTNIVLCTYNACNAYTVCYMHIIM